MGILLSAPQTEFEIIEEEWRDAVKQIAKRGEFIGGASVARFEKAFAEYIGAQGMVGVGNGTDALILALKSLGIGPGDEVITVANTFVATVAAIHHVGARAVLVDCDERTYLMDIGKVTQAVTARTKAIIAVHLYGQMVDLHELLPWAEERGIAVIEDGAQAVGARLYNRAVGNWGQLACFSFYPDKNLGAFGDAGGITGSSPELLSTLRKLRNHGGEMRYQHELPGFNSRLDPIQAIALDIKLKYIEQWTAKRIQIAKWYEHELNGISNVVLPCHRNDQSHVFHLFVIRVPDLARSSLMKHLQKKGILTGIHYPTPVHLTPAFSYLGYGPGDFQTSEKASKEILSLPMNITVSEQDVETVAKEIRNLLGGVSI
ncbi:DegT/DnrJ/EryC1/StrS family aminotransferase [Cohnella faecalis]|nr:DegT/DnrJ/EryC1/StrS family aminotransferase [Cohnella faecalis]